MTGSSISAYYMILLYSLSRVDVLTTILDSVFLKSYIVSQWESASTVLVGIAIIDNRSAWLGLASMIFAD
jgi:hypothetical protein